MFKKWILFQKIDNAKHSILFSGFLKIKTKFVLAEFYKTHVWKNLFVKSLPGVFGYKKIDDGSKLLASTFSSVIHGEVLDLCCGTGFLAISILHYAPKAIISLVDDDIAALHCSKLTLSYNNLKGKVICSNLYSNISQKFDFIVSNPPFHDDFKIAFKIINKIICASKKYLKSKGELRFVTNRYFNFDILLNKNFKRCTILKMTKTYKVYQVFLN